MSEQVGEFGADGGQFRDVSFVLIAGAGSDRGDGRVDEVGAAQSVQQGVGVQRVHEQVDVVIDAWWMLGE